MRLQLDPQGPGCSYSGLTSSITALLLAANAAVAYGQQLAKVTAVPVYLPEYEDSDWAALRGSVIGSVCFIFSNIVSSFVVMKVCFESPPQTIMYRVRTICVPPQSNFIAIL